MLNAETDFIDETTSFHVMTMVVSKALGWLPSVSRRCYLEVDNTFT